MSGIAPKQNVSKLKIAPHKQKSIAKNALAGKCPPLANGGERGTEQAFMTVAQRHRNQIIRGFLVIGKKKCLRWINKKFF
jgi:hypothetical protein